MVLSAQTCGALPGFSAVTGQAKTYTSGTNLAADLDATTAGTYYILNLVGTSGTTFPIPANAFNNGAIRGSVCIQVRHLRVPFWGGGDSVGRS